MYFVQCSTTTYNTFWQKGEVIVWMWDSLGEGGGRGGGGGEWKRLSVLQDTRLMYSDVWQRGDSSNAPIRKIICRTSHVEKKIINKLSPFTK